MTEEVYASVYKVVEEAYGETLALCKESDFSIFKDIDSLLFIRSCHIDKFENFVKKVYEKNKNIHWTIIGKDSDSRLLDEYYKGKYIIYNIDGKYDTDTIKPYVQTVRAGKYDLICMYSFDLSIVEYLNIYQCAEELSVSKKVIVCDYNGNLAEIKDISKWIKSMSVIEALCNWSWKEGVQAI